MALIKCPECKKKISDQCNSCPHCGYPITSSEESNANEKETLEKEKSTAENKNPIYKKVWFWIVVGIAVITIGVALFFIINRDTKPKYDKDGQPVFVDLTNEVYTNAKKYLGYHIEIKGQVFQVMGDNGKTKGIQIWLDPDTCEQNLMIYYSTDVEVKQGDYIKCTGYIDSVTKYKNAYDAELHVPLVISKDLEKATYIEVMSPTVECITLENVKQEQFGYSIAINKVEFAEKETRIYATATNNGKALMTIGDAVIVQGGKQYNSETNHDAEYEEIPYEVVKGVTCSGIIVFPTINNEDFELTISVHSDDYDEELADFVFKITKGVNSPNVESKEESYEESNEETSPSQTQGNNSGASGDKNNTTISRNEQAVNRANALAVEGYGATRSWVKEWLIKVDGYSEDEASYAMQNCSINWKQEALENAKTSVSEDNGGTRKFIGRSLAWGLQDYGYTSEEITYAMNNCGVNWKQDALNCANDFMSKDKEPQYLGGHLAEYNYTSDEISYAMNNINMNDYAIKFALHYGVGNTRTEVVNGLLSAGFTQSQADYGADNCGRVWRSEE